ncbi:uncharacterized protein LOC112349404 [Selaginella moellendorffii]|uniref:uncharacterized protein LOC112349404 n=1 Tax=Selaginella moellendorffii TaxID=88036 RepID=UPI000D1C9961|nr:uncharacterized protein LOC112349404 [Selaginella moellendorffii]|eukprot:XP_024539564.1 uncharacterized protein LOC112349404 [Selaginella moellendorffii]
MIHPALAWRRKSKDGAEPSEAVEAAAQEIDDLELKETSDDVPRAAEGTLTAVAASIKRSIAGMSRWSMADLTLGLYKLSGRHALEGAADTINGSRVSSLEELLEIQHWFGWAYAAYKKSKEKLAKDLKIEETQIIKHVFTSGVLKPAYFIAVDNVRHCVVISIRGTLAATDVLTDLNPHSEKFEGGYAHSGMLAAARWLMDNETTCLRDLLVANPEYRFVLVGHSLGAGTAALLCMLLRDCDGGSVGPLSRLGIPPSWITCWGYGCPPCVDKRLAEEAGFIRNIVLQDDVVARISPGALEDLRSEILGTDWSQAFKDGSKGKKMLELAQGTLPGVAMKYGQAALVVARSGALAGTKIHKAANWFTVGMAAAELLRSASTYRGVSTTENGDVDDDVDEKDSEIAAATLAANVAETVKDPKEAMEMERLYVPGLLYHILRKPLQPELLLELALPAAASSDDEKQRSESQETSRRTSKSSPKQKTKQPQFQHIVVRGDDPTSRFKRIVLSSTLLSDHGCHQYKESIQDAVTWIESE